MSGPKYVKDFEFPSGFGFTGSAHDSPRISVRPHERQRPGYAEGGKVEKPKDPDPKIKAQPPPPPKDDNKMSLAEIMKGDRRRQQEKELGLKKGGKVKRYAKGGDVAQDKKAIDSALKKHVNTPAPKGHKGLRGC
jgi:hypothetical protein